MIENTAPARGVTPGPRSNAGLASSRRDAPRFPEEGPALNTPSAKRIHRLFEISLALKGVSAVAECLGGIGFALVSTASIRQLVQAATQDEGSENPNNFIVSHLVGWAQSLSVSSKNFFVAFLLTDGVLKLALVAGVLGDRLWAYPASLVVLVLFILYQMYAFVVTQSLGFIALTIFDCLVIFLMWHEYRLVRRMPRVRGLGADQEPRGRSQTRPAAFPDRC